MTTRLVSVAVLACSVVACAPSATARRDRGRPDPGDRPARSESAVPTCTPLACPADTAWTMPRPGVWTCQGQTDQPVPSVTCDGDALVEAGTLMHGKRTGTWEFRDPSARRETSYREGVMHGSSRIWSASGQLLVEGAYVDGQADGDFRSWHPNGTPRELGRFAHGRKVGRWQTWFDNGAAEVVETYDNGVLSGPYEQFDRGGLPLFKGHMVAGQKSGQWLHYRAGKLVRQEGYRDGWLDGPIIEWQPGTTQKVYEGAYADRRKAGRWVYYKDGTPEHTEHYRRGQLARRCVDPASERRCEELVVRVEVSGCSVRLEPGQHVIATTDAELRRVADCQIWPTVDWSKEALFVASLVQDSNAGWEWTSSRDKAGVHLRLQVGHACQGTLVRQTLHPVLVLVETGGRRLDFKVEAKPHGPCGQVP